jgi:hypothetical protein
MEDSLKRPFQFRSSERDAQTDKERVKPIVDAIKAAVATAESERSALSLRVNQARDLASFAAGTGGDEYLTREAKDSSRIEGYEKQMIVGEKRLGELEAQIVHLKALQDLSNRYFSEFMK